MTPRELSAAFDVLAEAPGGIQRLRELVLELAVRGKLVPQDPRDEPASVLLERIAAEKARLVGEGKIRKPKPLPPVSADEVPFEVPGGWVWERFANVAEIASNLVSPDGLGHMPHVAPDSIEKGTGKLLRYRTVREDGVRSGKHRFFPGQIIYSKIRPNLSKVIKVDFEGLCSADMYPIKPFVGRDYLHVYMLSVAFLNVVTSGDNRVAMPKINQEQLSLVPVSVPPLPEQHRIVARVDELMALLDRLEGARTAREASRAALRAAALAALRDAPDAEAVEAAWARVAERMDDLFTDPADVPPLRQTILQLAVRGRLVPQDPRDEPARVLLDRIAAEKARLVKQGKIKKPKPLPPVNTDDVPFDVPGGWVWARVEDCFDVAGGIQKSAKRRPVQNSYPYLRVANVQRGKLDLTEMAQFELFEGELERWRLVIGDLLVVEGNGSESEIGRCARWNGAIKDCVHQNHLIRCRPLTDSLEHFVLRYLNSPAGTETMKALAVTTSGLYNLSVGKIRNIVLPIPPLPEQHRIVARGDALMSLCDDLEARLRAAREAQAAFAAAAVHHLDA